VPDLRIELAGTGAVLRGWQPVDAASIVAHANDRRVWRNLRDRFPHPYTAADAADWLARRVGEQPPLEFAIEVGGAAAGACGVHVLDDVNARTAEIGYWLGFAHWGRGIASAAVPAVTRHVFATRPELERIEAWVFGWNPASARVLEKAGYRLEGRLRARVRKDGETTDQLAYALLRSDLG
jgi:RimJ/RimL family protein N-acetyltransferase